MALFWRRGADGAAPAQRLSRPARAVGSFDFGLTEPDSEFPGSADPDDTHAQSPTGRLIQVPPRCNMDPGSALPVAGSLRTERMLPRAA